MSRLLKTISSLLTSKNSSDVIAEKPKPASENSEPIKSEYIKLSNSLGYRPHDDHAERRKRVSSSTLPLHSLACFIQHDDNEVEKKTKGSLKCHWTDCKFNLPIWQKSLLVPKTKIETAIAPNGARFNEAHGRKIINSCENIFRHENFWIVVSIVDQTLNEFTGAIILPRTPRCF